MNSHQVLAAIIRHLESRATGDQYVYIPELVVTLDGFERRIDLFVMNAWASHGHERTAFEIKVSRADFLREIRAGKKTDAMLSVAERAYFVTPKGLIQPDEVPAGCGLMEVTAQGCSYKIKAPKHETPRNITAAMLVQAQRRFPMVRNMILTGEGEITQRHLVEAERKGYDRATKDANDRAARERERFRQPDHERVIREHRELMAVAGELLGKAWLGEITEGDLAKLRALRDQSPDELRRVREAIANLAWGNAREQVQKMIDREARK